jgi:predicted permease
MSFPVLVSTFANNILPILLLGGAGFALGKLLHIEARSLGRVVFYVFSPVLVFDLLRQNRLELKEALGVMSLTVCVVLSMGLITYLLGMLFKLERSALIAILITTMFANTGNYGLPLVSFAFCHDHISLLHIGRPDRIIGTYELQGSPAGVVQDPHHVCRSAGGPCECLPD